MKKERTKKKKKIKTHTKDFSDSAPSTHSSAAPSLPSVRGGNSRRGSFPLAPGVQGRAVPRGSRLPGPAPRCRRRRLLAARRLRAGDGVASGASALRSARERAEGALGGAGPEGPEPTRSRAKPLYVRAGGWRSRRPRSCYPCLPARASHLGQDLARRREKEKKKRKKKKKKKAHSVPKRSPSLTPLRTRGRPAGRQNPPPNSFKVVLSPWALQRR